MILPLIVVKGAKLFFGLNHNWLANVLQKVTGNGKRFELFLFKVCLIVALLLLSFRGLMPTVFLSFLYGKYNSQQILIVNQPQTRHNLESYPMEAVAAVLAVVSGCFLVALDKTEKWAVLQIVTCLLIDVFRYISKEVNFREKTITLYVL